MMAARPPITSASVVKVHALQMRRISKKDKVATDIESNDPIETRVETLHSVETPQELSLGWGISSPVGQELSLGWGISSPVGQELSLGWGISSPVGQQLSLGWGISSPVGQELSLGWGISSPVGAMRAGRDRMRRGLREDASFRDCDAGLIL
jgi:hypothetical protein